MASPQRPRGSADAGRNPNVFDDEYEVDVPETELDHRPIGHSVSREPGRVSRTRSRTPSHSTAERRSISNKEPAERSSTPRRACRNSIAKDQRDFVDAGSVASTRTLNGYAAHWDMRNRPTSTASEFAHFEDRSSTPVHGRSASGYNYNQSGLPRSSTASESPSRQSTTYTPARPAYPYGLYNQTSLPVEEDNAAADGTVPIGFPGRINTFQRRIGPDGEEQDIVGPDGHTEELPPYSKYPNGETKIVTATIGSLSPIQQTLGAIPVEAPQRTPNLESATANGPADSAQSSINEKKAWKDKTFTEKRRTKVCWGCIPLWMLLTLVGVFFLSAVAIGGTIGGLLAAEKKKKKNNPPVVTVTSTASMLDALPIPSPKGISPIPTGEYTMSFGIPQEQQRSCLTDSNQYNTWMCNTPPQPVLVKIGSPSSPYQFLGMQPNIPSPSSSGSVPRYNFSYGGQYPIVVPPQRLFWVSDVEEPSRGPALHFQTMYDKLVILDDDQVSSSSKSKREAQQPGYPDFDDIIFLGESSYSTYPPSPYYASPTSYATSSASSAATSSDLPGASPSGSYHRKTQLSTGDQPWFCWWNQTWVEGFICMNSKSPSSGKKRKMDDGIEESSPTTTIPPIYGDGLVRREIHPRDADFAEAHKMYLNAMTQQVKRMESTWPSATADPSSSSIYPNPTPSPPSFPYTMKIQERRIPCNQTVQPYCQKMYISAEGLPVPILDNNGQPIRFNIKEDSASFKDQQEILKASASASASASGSKDKDKRGVEQPKQLIELMRRDDDDDEDEEDDEDDGDDGENSCQCLWVTSPPSS